MVESRKKNFIQKLNYKLRLVLINDENFEEKFSFKLTPLNVFAAFSSFIVLFTIIITIGIFYTPLKEYVPGYTDTETRSNVIRLLQRTDSLEQAISDKNKYILNLKSLLNGGTGLALEDDSTRQNTDNK